jgi:hypothetical protein
MILTNIIVVILKEEVAEVFKKEWEKIPKKTRERIEPLMLLYYEYLQEESHTNKSFMDWLHERK